MAYALGFVGALLLIAVVVALIRHAIADETRRLEAWRSFAEASGHRLLPSSGPWYARSRTRIAGERDGVPFEIKKHVVSNGKSVTVFTRVVARVEPAPEGKLSVQRRGFWTGVGEKLGLSFVPTGDHAFDARFGVRAKPPELAATFVDERARERIAAFPKRGWLKFEHGELRLTWHRLESDPAVLESAIAVVAAMGAASRRGGRSLTRAHARV